MIFFDTNLVVMPSGCCDIAEHRMAMQDSTLDSWAMDMEHSTTKSFHLMLEVMQPAENTKNTFFFSICLSTIVVVESLQLQSNMF